MNIDNYKGPSAFGKAYQAMLENDSHADGSVDRVIVNNMVRLCPETTEYLYTSHTTLNMCYTLGSRPQLETAIKIIRDAARDHEDMVSAIAAFTCGLAKYAEHNPYKMQLGGTEEEIIDRGSEWCTDVARVACVLFQIAGYPSRIVNLFDIQNAYCGHVIVEAHRNSKWGAVDSSSGVVYRNQAGYPATTWELMISPSLIEAHKTPAAWYTTIEQFRAAGVSNYHCWESADYSFAKSGANPYLLSILAMDSKKWPGGLRWIRGEDIQEIL